MRKNGYCILFSILMACLIFPIIQEHCNVVEFKKLFDTSEKVRMPSLTMDNYISGKYQADLESYISQNQGLRAPSIRIYNQYLWSFYKKTYIKHCILGKDGWLYFKQDYDDYCGTEIKKYFKSNEEAQATFDRNIRTTYKVYNLLKELGIDYVVMLPPDKCEIYPQFLPDSEYDTTSINARDYYLKRFDELGIPYISFNPYFKELADTLPFPVFSKQGIHWNFSSVYAADSLINYICNVKGMKKPELHIGELRKYDKKTTKNNLHDYDLENNLNLLFPMDHKSLPLYLADVTVTQDSSEVKARPLFVGNSYIWRIRDLIPLQEVFVDPRVLYYNKTLHYGKKFSIKLDKGDFSPIQEVLKSDMIVFYICGHQMYKYSYGFNEKLLVQLCIPDSIMRKEKIRISDSAGISLRKAEELIYKNPEIIPQLKGDIIPTTRNTEVLQIAEVIKKIESDTTWTNTLNGHAKYRNRSFKLLEEQEAKFYLSNSTLLGEIAADEGEKMYMYEMDKIINRYKSNPQSMEKIREKADKKDVSEEEMLELDARWTIENNFDKYFHVIYENDSIHKTPFVREL